MRLNHPAVALCACAALLTLPACHRHAAARKPLATNQSRGQPATGTVVMPGTIERISVALHTAGEPAKDPADQVTVRILRGADVIAQQSVGLGEQWNAGAVRAIEIPLPTPVPLSQARDLRVDVSKLNPVAQPGIPWTVQAEALAQLTDGRVVRLLEPSPPQAIGNQTATRSWALTPE